MRVTDVHEASLAVEIADARETRLIRQGVEQLPAAIGVVAREQSEVIEVGLGATVAALDDIGAELDQVRGVLREIHDTIQDGFARLSVLAQAQLERLEAIERLLERPLDTVTRELRQRGLRAYRHGLLDEALADLTKVVEGTEKIEGNPYDHISHLHIGHIRLRRDRHASAAEAYRKAIRYALAAPKGDDERAEFHGAMAFLGLARAVSEQGNADEAVDAARQAVQLAPGRGDTNYEYARCAALAGDRSTASSGN